MKIRFAGERGMVWHPECTTGQKRLNRKSQNVTFAEAGAWSVEFEDCQMRIRVYRELSSPEYIRKTCILL